MPSARSRARAPVGIASIPTLPRSPSRMIEPLPNCFSIWPSVMSSDLSRSTVDPPGWGDAGCVRVGGSCRWDDPTAGVGHEHTVKFHACACTLERTLVRCKDLGDRRTEPPGCAAIRDGGTGLGAHCRATLGTRRGRRLLLAPPSILGCAALLGRPRCRRRRAERRLRRARPCGRSARRRTHDRLRTTDHRPAATAASPAFTDHRRARRVRPRLRARAARVAGGRRSGPRPHGVDRRAVAAASASRGATSSRPRGLRLDRHRPGRARRAAAAACRSSPSSAPRPAGTRARVSPATSARRTTPRRTPRSCASRSQRYAPLGVHDVGDLERAEPRRRSGGRAPTRSRTRSCSSQSSTAIHDVDPTATVMNGGLSPAPDDGGEISPLTFLRRVYELGGGPYLDAVAHHPYQYPDRPTSPEPTNAFLQTRAAPRPHGRVRRRRQADLGHRGRRADARRAVGERGEPGDWLREYYDVWNGWAFTGPLLWFTARDTGDGDRIEDSYGLVHHDRTPKPALGGVRGDGAARSRARAPRDDDPPGGSD